MFLCPWTKITLLVLAVFFYATIIAQPDRAEPRATTLIFDSEPRCIYQSSPTTVYCATPLDHVNKQLDASNLPTLEDVGGVWQELTHKALLSQLGSSEGPQLGPETPLEKRHDWAMSCLMEKGLTDDCHKNFGYFCNVNGRLETTKKETEEGCDTCECISLYPEPPCIMSLVGNVYCLRNVHDDELLSDLKAQSQRAPSSSPQSDKTAPQLIYPVPQLVYDMGNDKPNTYSKILGVNNMALVCADNRQITRNCQDSNHQYFCNEQGQVKRNGHYSDWVCDRYCECYDLYTKNYCIATIIGSFSCLRKRDGSKLEWGDSILSGIQERNLKIYTKAISPPPQVASSTPRKRFLKSEVERTVEQPEHVPASLDTRDLQRIPAYNNYAMVCAGDSHDTNDCSRKAGYYCNSEGTLMKQWENGNGDGGWQFYCYCHNMFPRPTCVLGLTGMTYCLRDDGLDWNIDPVA